MSSLEGRIHIGALSGWVPLSLITARLSEFQQRYPRVRLELATFDQNGLESELISERLTFAITADVDAGRAANDFVAFQPWGDMEFMAVTTPAYVLRAGPFERPESLLLADVVEVGDNHPILSRWARAGDLGLQAVLAQLKPAMTVPDHDTALNVIASGHGWGFVPHLIAASALGSGKLVTIAVKPSPPQLSLSLLFRRKRTRTLAESVFLEFWLDEKPGPRTIEVKAVK